VVACSPAASHFLLNFHRALTYVDSVSEPAQQAGAALHVIANFDCYFHTVAEHHVNAGAELDQPNALAALHEVTDLRRENNPPRQYHFYLFEDYGVAIEFYCIDVHLVRY